jgi:hypothetical protein
MPFEAQFWAAAVRYASAAPGSAAVWASDGGAIGHGRDDLALDVGFPAGRHGK